MRRLSVTWLTVAVASVGLAVQSHAATTTATKSGGCPMVDENGMCLADEDHPLPTQPIDPPTPSNATVDASGYSSSLCRDGSGRVIPCVNDFGFSWIPGAAGPNAGGAPGDGCYGFELDQQPTAGSPLWEGEEPSEGAIWSCDATVSVEENTWFVADSEPAVPQIIDAAGVAQVMLERASFEIADLQMAPPYGFHTYLRVENWFWVPESQWHAVSLTENVGPASVTLAATPSQLEVDTGDARPAPTRCPDAGRPWVRGMSDGAQTTCSYAYESIENPEGDTYTVTGRLYYDVSWTCAGRCSAPAGQLGEYPAPQSEPQQVEVRQRQTVVTN